MNAAWIPSLSARDTLRLLQAVAAPRTLVVMLGAAAWTIGLGWMATMVRFNQGGYEPAEEQRYLNGLMVSLLVFALPAMCGVVVAEVTQELLRRPLTNRLPDMVRRTAAAACTLAWILAAVLGTLAFAASSPESVVLGPSESTQPTVLAYVTLALLGYPAGAWLRGHLGPRALWVVRLALFLVLAYGAITIVHAVSESVAAGLVLAALGIAATRSRFHPRICVRVAQSGMPTTFQFLAGLSGGTGAPRDFTGDGGRRYPSGPMGGNLRGWWRAHRYELVTMNRSVGPDTVLALLSAASFLFCIGWPPLVQLVLRGEATGASAAELLGGVRGAMDLGFASSLRRTFLVVGSFSAGIAVLGAGPFCNHFPRPIARRQRVSLSLLVAARTLAVYLAWFVVLALLARVWILPLVGVDPAPGVPPILRVFLAQSVLFAPFVTLTLWAGHQMRRSRRWRSFGLLVLGMVLLFGSAGSLEHWADANLWNSWWQAALALVGALVVGFALLGLALSCHYRRCDLV